MKFEIEEDNMLSKWTKSVLREMELKTVMPNAALLIAPNEGR